MNGRIVHPSLKAFGSRSRGGSRRGAAIIYVLVVLTICGLLVSLLAQHLFLEQRVLQGAARAAQARWLAEAGIARARARHAAEAGYMGETWQIAAGEMPGSQAATVTIVLQNDPSSTTAKSSIEVVAQYPSGSDHRATYRKQVPLEDQGVGP